MALQTENTNIAYFLEEGQLIGIAPDASLGFNGKEVCWIELEIEGTSSGYYDPGCYLGSPEECYPPESDDERLITTVNAVFHNEFHQTLGHMEITDEELLKDIQQTFDERLYKVDLPEGYDDPPEPDYPDEY